MSEPFSRIDVLVAALNAAGAMLVSAQAGAAPQYILRAAIARDMALNQLYGYKSRGHGRARLPSPQFNRQAMRSKYMPHQGRREMARRVRQMEAARG